MSTKTIDISIRLDGDLFREQRGYVIDLALQARALGLEPAGRLDGLLGLLDSIADQAADDHGMTECLLTEGNDELPDVSTAEELCAYLEGDDT